MHVARSSPQDDNPASRREHTSTPVYEGGGLVIPAPPATKTFATRLRQSMLEFEDQLKDTEDLRMIATLGGKAYQVEHIAIRGAEMAVIDGPAQEASGTASCATSVRCS